MLQWEFVDRSRRVLPKNTNGLPLERESESIVAFTWGNQCAILGASDLRPPSALD
jgi:hypothetical protein